MARRSRAELLEEGRRVGAVWDAWREWRIAHPLPGRSRVEATTSPSEPWLAPAPGGPTLSQLLAGMRQAINDIGEGLTHGLEANDPDARAFLAHYRERTGREWWADAGDPATMARAILRRGRIRDETEWHLLDGILGDVDQRALSEQEAARAGDLLRAFEARREG